MKAAWYEQNGPARDVLHVGELDKPVAEPGTVLVRVHATSVNPSDTKSRAGRPLLPGNLRQIPHQDGAGIIEQVGSGIDPSRVGERVWIYEALISGKAGCAAEYVSVPAPNAVRLPDTISFETGACLGVPALTAHRCIFADGPVTGQTVLVTGGAGAVGVHAIQFAKSGGARVFTTVSREEQAVVARAAGADAVFNRHDETWVTRIQQAAGSPGDPGSSGTSGNPGTPAVDRIVDVAFGANLPATLQLLKPNGIVATYASDAEPEPVLPFWPLVFLDATIRFVLVYKMTREAHQQAIAATTKGLEEGWLKTTVAVRFPLSQIAQAHEASESGTHIGKVVVLID